MPENPKPWQRQSAFTLERLSKIATSLRDARDYALNIYEPLRGQTKWSLGCVQYDFSTFCIRELAKANPTWLSVVTEKSPLRCTFAIESVPVRFYHQTADEPPEKYTMSTDGEKKLHQMLFEVDGIPFVETLYRLAIKDYSTGKVESIILVEFDKTGAIIDEYDIPFGIASSNIVVPLQAKPVTIEPVALEPIKSEQPENQIADDENDDTNTGTK